MKELWQILNCFSSQAFDSNKSKGRKNQEKEEMIVFETIDDPFWIDEQKIIQSKSFRRLAGKTQVFPLSSNSMVRNRLIHSLEVKSIAETIAKILGLNVSLVRAIATGHDTGHTPFGHLGERAISKISGQEFRHEIFGPILLEQIERKGKGLNLCHETLEGIRHHSRGGGNLAINKKIPLEYSVVMLADKIAYTFSDINDSLRFQRFQKNELPESIKKLGKNQREQVSSCITSLCLESASKGYLSFSDSETAKNFKDLRDWMYQKVYLVLDDEPERLGLFDKIISTHKFIEESLLKFLEYKKIDSFKILATMTGRYPFLRTLFLQTRPLAFKE